MQIGQETLITMPSQNPNQERCESNKKTTLNQQEHSTTSEEIKVPSANPLDITNDLVAKESNNNAKLVKPNTTTYNGRERLKRHRVEAAGRVWVPDMWAHENMLHGWIDCTAFDAGLVNTKIISARDALRAEGRMRAATSNKFRIENSC